MPAAPVCAVWPVAVPAPASAKATVTCFSLAGARLTVKVRSVEPRSPSSTLGESTERVGGSSSSVIVRVTDDGAVTPCEFAAAPETVTLSSGSSVSSSAAVIVTVPVLLVPPAAMVSVFSALRAKSAASVSAPGTADTVIVVSALDGRFSEAVTVVEPVLPPSSMEDRDRASVTVGCASSSVIVPVPVAVPMVALAARLNTIATVSFGSLVVSPVIETVIVLRISPAAKVRVPPPSAR